MFGHPMGAVLHRCRQLANECRAATAIEFAILSTLFFPLLVAVFDVALIAFADQLMNKAAQNAARKIQIGEISEDRGGEAAFRNQLCTDTLGFFNCEDFRLQVDVFDDFSSATVEMIDAGDSGEDEGESEEIEENFELGGPEEIVVIRVIYDWPFMLAAPMRTSAQSGDNTARLVATTVVRNEPGPES